ncbi:aromatic amino acid DMT transporter YddG [Brucella pituitosa]|uniref:aromatic amino acid DMT transporter YddG n=1 Tax=Brucella pituitosa TaxID=571256 RepID=UPI001C27C26E|nr:aromatic amino acid DMT transporter YddG [Brucella pituitosa]
MRLHEMTNLTTLDNVSNETQLSTLVGMIAIPLWSVSIGFIRSVSEIFGPIAGAALIYTTSGILGALVLGLPKLRDLKNPGIWYSGLLFVAYEISLALAIGLAHNRDQALELGMINYLWPSVTILFAVLTGQQRGSWLLAVALGFCLMGIGWVMKGDNELSLDLIFHNIQDNPLAYIYAFSAALLWGLYSVVTRHFDNGKSAVPLYFLLTAAVLWTKYTISDGPALVLHWNGLGQILVFCCDVCCCLCVLEPGCMSWEYLTSRNRILFHASTCSSSHVLVAWNSTGHRIFLRCVNDHGWVFAMLVGYTADRIIKTAFPQYGSWWHYTRT